MPIRLFSYVVFLTDYPTPSEAGSGPLREVWVGRQENVVFFTVQHPLDSREQKGAVQDTVHHSEPQLFVPNAPAGPSCSFMRAYVQFLFQ